MTTTSSATTEANVALIREYVKTVFNEHHPERSADYVTPDVKWHGQTLGTVESAEKVTALLQGFIGALPDLRAIEQQLIADGDLVVVRFTIEATHSGNLFGVPATGRRVAWDAVDIYRMEDGKIAEEWAADDTTAILHSIGLFTPPWLTCSQS